MIQYTIYLGENNTSLEVSNLEGISDKSLNL